MENTFDLKKFLIENELTHNSRLLKEGQLSDKEQDIVDDILSGLSEGAFDDVLQKVKTYARKGALTAAMVTALLASSNLTQAQKSQIKNTVTTTIAAPTQKVNSASTPIPGSVKSINFAESFASGKATLTNKSSLASSINDIKTWIAGKKIDKFKVVITASESQVTNQAEFKAPGSLAKARAKAVEDELKGLGFKTIDIKTKIGTTPYEPGNNINDPKYQAEQFVTVDIVVDNSICSMPPVDEGAGQGEAKTNYVTYNDYISGKGTLSFTPGQIPDRLVILDANGNIKEDTGYVTTQASRYKDWTYTPAYVLELTLRYKTNPKAFTGNKIEKITVKDYEDLKSQLSSRQNAPTAGDEIGPALVQMEKMIENGQTEFIVYENGKTAKVVNFDDTRGDVKVMVYSPVGKTGFGIKGNCK
ncbi:hypothetical protein N9795_00980 [Candidatus Pelagibacter sp.]|nr:hypothetical protein [Candidatus Pelagibacter sp.]